MDKHLLHQPVEEVLLFGVGAFGHHLLEVVHDGLKQLPVDGWQFQPLPPARNPWTGRPSRSKPARRGRAWGTRIRDLQGRQLSFGGM